jgi:N,N-dimethylformamidase
MSTANDVLVPPGVMGYVDRTSVAAGETVRLHVSSTAPSWRAELVRLRALEIPVAGTPRREERVAAVPAIERETIPQPVPVGSYVRIDGARAPGPGGLTVSALLMPTRPGEEAQTAVGQRTADGTAGWALGLDAEGRPRLWVATASGPVEVAGPEPVVQGCWYRVTGTVDPAAGTVRLAVLPVGTFAANRVATGRGTARSVEAPLPAPMTPATGAPLLLGCGWTDADGQPQERYDGKLERPLVVGAPVAPGEIPRLSVRPQHEAMVGAWDLGAGAGPQGFRRPSHVEDVGPHGRHGVCVNHPTRAVTGPAWTGDVVDFRHAPEHYGAIHFHRTDMTDCRWTPQAEITLPDDLQSGVYAFVLTAEGELEDRVPLIVRPPRDRPTAKALLVLSTNSYLAYANDHVGVDSPRTQVWNQMVPALDGFERFRDAHRELGLSLYETHADGHGVCHSGWNRPILTMRATVYDGDGPVWQFTGDMQLVDWLDRTGREVDVVCDRDVHEGGVDLLSRYACVMTGTHPEYPSEEMLDAYEEYVGTGGRLMYMGGNGMYWVTAYDPENPNVVEIRRWGATQAWLAPPGEYHLSFTGQQGGIWRFRGRAPQKTFGVGFVAAGGVTASAGYLRRVTAGTPAGWVLDGVREDEFGRYGTMGGAAGTEIDAVDPLLGTPAATVVLASSVGHSDDMLESRENFNMTSRILGGARNPRAHSDLVLVPREAGGAVFSTGSIAFAGSLAHEDGDNDVSRLLGNVFDRFVSGAPVLDEAGEPAPGD